MRKSLFLLIFLLSCAAVCSKLSAQDAFTSSRLNELFAQLPLECKNALSRSTENKCRCGVKGNTLPIKASFNSQGQLSHLGMDLFSFDANLLYPNTVLSFIERSFLEYFVWNDVAIIDKKNKEDKIALLINGKQFNSLSNEKLSGILPILQSDAKDLNIKQDSLYYQATISSGKENVKLLFAANYQVVSGMDKKEYAQQIINSLKTYKAKSNLSPSLNPLSLKPYREDLKVNIGKAYYKTISSNTYFKCAGNECEPVFDGQYPLESFTNAFLTAGDFNKDITLSIEQKIYANEKEQYEVELSDYLAYFKNDFELYFGMENNSEKILDGTLILYNRQLNFINLLYVSASPQELFSTGKRVLKAKFYTNIPSDNIKNLFAEKENTK